MKQILNLLAVVILTTSIGFSQAKPVKKVVTSKITKDPKTGKVVKTITTTTITDVVLNPGTAQNTTNTNAPTVKKAAPQPTKAVVAVKKPSSKPTVTKQPAVVATKPAVVVAQKPAVVAKPTTQAPNNAAEESTVVKLEEDNSIFANPTDKSASNNNVVKQAEKPAPINTPIKTPANKQGNATNNSTAKTPTKVFKENTKTPRTSRTYWGLRGGANLASVESPSSQTQIYNAIDELKKGLNGGLLLNIGLSKVFSIQPEVNYSQQGYSITNGIDSEKLDNQTLNVPLLLKMAVGNKFKFFVNAGPYYSHILTSEKTTFLNGQTIRNIVNFDEEANKETQVRRMDYGLQGGAGFQISLGGPKLEIEGRYNYGLADPMLYSNSKPSYIGEIGRTRLITGTMALLFPIGK
jgi:hypothetical protein